MDRFPVPLVPASLSGEKVLQLILQTRAAPSIVQAGKTSHGLACNIQRVELALYRFSK